MDNFVYIKGHLLNALSNYRSTEGIRMLDQGDSLVWKVGSEDFKVLYQVKITFTELHDYPEDAPCP